MLDSLATLFSLEALLLMFLGTSLGVIVGAIPGLTGAMLIALSLPLTFGMSGEMALVLLISMYVGTVSGGLVTATLLRIPGTPASMMTTLDGYPLALQGKSGRALGLGVMASLVGGLVSWGFLVILSAPLAKLSLQFGPFDFFALVMMALILIVSVSGESLINGLLSGTLGLLAAMPGASAATGQPRWTLGFHELNDGLKLLPVLIGLFAVNQVLSEAWNLNRGQAASILHSNRISLNISDWFTNRVNLLRSSLIGTFIGILPGIGANIGSVVAYSVAKSQSSHPEKFGTGTEEGIIASEAANNATVGGALIPLIAMGIPGSVIDAILLGALVIHGLQPGPLLMEQNPEVVHIIMWTMLFSNLLMFGLMTFSIGWLAKLASLPKQLLIPTILTFCVIGSYALANRMFDVWVMLGFGVIGFFMERSKIPLAPFVIGFVLAPIGEEHLSEGLMQTNGDWWPLLTRPIAGTLTTLTIALLVFTMYQHYRGHQLQAKSQDD
ncbi:tripartite tricarboxylate transporter permease [Thalassoglobus sp. JC818]|uniref:tripartite tricarboxylate transporter permease n=1 Tax=Thalassoglobus sp. JC818 TaxID=3232136 RepID=UPI00345ADF4F